MKSKTTFDKVLIVVYISSTRKKALTSKPLRALDNILWMEFEFRRNLYANHFADNVLYVSKIQRAFLIREKVEFDKKKEVMSRFAKTLDLSGRSCTSSNRVKGNLSAIIFSFNLLLSTTSPHSPFFSLE